MAANRTFLAMTTGRFGAPMGGLRPAEPTSFRGHARVCAFSTFSGTASAGLSAAAQASALALSLQLPIGCRA